MEGGYGPGSYYFPIMIQFIFLFPVIYFVISKYKTKGLIISGVLNISFEIFKNIINMNVDLYRLLVFRYIFIIAFGAYVYIEDDKRKLNIINVLLFLIGIVFNILITYNFYSPIIFNCWTSTCMFASFLICFVVSMCIERVNIKSKCIELVSDSSFNIFLVQMVWFKFGQSIFCDTINNLFLRLLLSVIVCVIVGIIFRYIEKPITKKIANYLN